ncbi:MAG: phosphoglyceromutase [Bacteroidota bacterium]
MKNLCLLLFFCISTTALPQPIENLIIITTDGLRWQEVFTGMDTAIANDSRYNQDDRSGIYEKYWSDNLKERRKLLMPFFWSTVAAQGTVFGNRGYDNLVNTANPYWFSYPGYSELFTGYVDTLINTNNYKNNPNTTLLDFLQQQPAFTNRIAGFGAWYAFDRILNEPRAGFPVICGFDTVASSSTEQQLINKMLKESYRHWDDDECQDVFTHHSAMQYLKERSPKVLFVGYGETDEWAHAGEYKDYLNAAHQVDDWIRQLWEYTSQHPQYKNKTAFLITVDHGRGDEVKKQWTSHNASIAGADETWFAIIAPGIKGKGELRTAGKCYQEQLAQTMATLLGLTFTAEHPVANGIPLAK